MTAPIPFLIPYFISLFITGGLAVYAVSRREVQSAGAFALLGLMQVSLIVAYIFELIAVELQAKIMWDNFQFIGSLFVPTATLYFAREFTGQERPMKRWQWLALLIIPAISIALVYTDPMHGLIRQDARLIEGTPFDELTYTFTPTVYAMAGYIYLIMFVAYGHLARHMFRVQPAHRLQIGLALAGLMLPVLVNVFTLLGLTTTFHRDNTPFAFALGGLLLTWSIFRHHLFDVVPVARTHIIENMADPVIVLDAQNRIVDLNPAAEKLAGMPIKNATGKSLDDLFPSAAGIIEQRAETAEQIVEIDYNHEELGEITFDVHLSPLRNRGQHVGQVAVLRNVTERKEAETNLRRARREAEAAQKQAEEADQVKSQFLTSMSHELRTPLNGVLSLVEMVLHEMFGPLNERQKEYLTQAIESGEHLLALINDILDINRIQAGMLSLFIEENVELEAELRYVVEATRALLHDKPVKLVTDFDPKLPTLTCDRRRVRQILLNLTSNAAKFTEKGSVTLSVKCFDDAEILFAVSDTGPGIDARERSAVFEPFTQTQSGKRERSGSGMGLPISKHLTEAHGGRIWFDTEPGEGTTFFVALPVQARQEAR